MKIVIREQADALIVYEVHESREEIEVLYIVHAARTRKSENG
jgi:hypothetical protein